MPGTLVGRWRKHRMAVRGPQRSGGRLLWGSRVRRHTSTSQCSLRLGRCAPRLPLAACLNPPQLRPHMHTPSCPQALGWRVCVCVYVCACVRACAGAWACAYYRRVVRYKALGSSVPPYIEVNVRNLDLEQAVLVRDMPVPPGTKLYEKVRPGCCRAGILAGRVHSQRCMCMQNGNVFPLYTASNPGRTSPGGGDGCPTPCCCCCHCRAPPLLLHRIMTRPSCSAPQTWARTKGRCKRPMTMALTMTTVEALCGLVGLPCLPGWRMAALASVPGWPPPPRLKQAGPGHWSRYRAHDLRS